MKHYLYRLTDTECECVDASYGDGGNGVVIGSHAYYLSAADARRWKRCCVAAWRNNPPSLSDDEQREWDRKDWAAMYDIERVPVLALLLDMDEDEAEELIEWLGDDCPVGPVPLPVRVATAQYYRDRASVARYHSARLAGASSATHTFALHAGLAEQQAADVPSRYPVKMSLDRGTP